MDIVRTLQFFKSDVCEIVALIGYCNGFKRLASTNADSIFEMAILVIDCPFTYRRTVNIFVQTVIQQ
jgi:hypothetical protein